jgi:hypothetical protein
MARFRRSDRIAVDLPGVGPEIDVGGSSTFEEEARRDIAMKHSIRQFTVGLALLLASLTVQGLGQSTPQQVKGTGWEAATTKTPAVASDGQNLYIAWTGLSNHEIYFAMFNGKEWTDHQVVEGPGWTAETSASPALVYVPGGYGVFLFWRGLSPNQEIWISEYTQGKWWPQQRVLNNGWEALTKTAPAVALLNETIYVAWLGAGSPDIWYTSLNLKSPSFALQQKLGGSNPTWTAETDAAPALAAYFNPPDGTGPLSALAFLWRGSGEGHIWESWNSQTQSEISCPGASTAQPAAAFAGSDSNDLMVFWKDENDDGISFQNGSSCGSVTGDGWTAQTKIAPAVASFADPSGSGTSILAWLDATSNTIWYIDPSTLP